MLINRWRSQCCILRVCIHFESSNEEGDGIFHGMNHTKGRPQDDPYDYLNEIQKLQRGFLYTMNHINGHPQVNPTVI